MSNLGKYQDIVEESHKAGGPDIWIGSIKKEAYNQGASDMKDNLVGPLLMIGFGIGIIVDKCYPKIKKLISKKREEKLLAQKEAEQAEQLLKKELDEAIEELDTSTNSQ